MSRMSRGRAAAAAKASCCAMPPACAGNAPAGEARDDVPPDSNALDAFFAHAEVRVRARPPAACVQSRDASHFVLGAHPARVGQESELARCSALYGLDLRTEQPLRDSDWDWSYAGGAFHRPRAAAARA